MFYDYIDFSNAFRTTRNRLVRTYYEIERDANNNKPYLHSRRVCTLAQGVSDPFDKRNDHCSIRYS